MRTRLCAATDHFIGLSEILIDLLRPPRLNAARLSAAGFHMLLSALLVISLAGVCPAAEVQDPAGSLPTHNAPIPDNDAKRPEGPEPLVVRLIFNQEDKGDIFIYLTRDGDILMKVSDLVSAGIREPMGLRVEMGGEQHVSLKSIRDTEYEFDEKTLSLKITVSPLLFPKSTIDFSQRRNPAVLYPRDPAAFFNYSLDFSAGGSFDFRGLTIANQAGLRFGDLLFVSDSSYFRDSSEDRFTRLMSRLIYERREDLQRLTIGDFNVTTGELGSSLNMAGVNLSKIYAMDPYLRKNPSAFLSGLASVPSEVDVYLNGIKMRTQKVPPGEFELKDLFNYGGNNLIEVVVRDAFGREQRILYPFYFTDVVLKQGLHEYSYSAGFKREDFGVTSNRYSDFIFSAYHRYGVSDFFNIGARAEGVSGRYNIGQGVSFLFPSYGIISLALAESRDRAGDCGVAGLFNYSYQDSRVGASLFVKGFSKDYTPIEETTREDRRRYEAGAGISYGMKELGSISLNYNKSERYTGQTTHAAAFTYNKTISGNISLFATFRQIRETTSRSEFFFGITYYPWKDISLSSGYHKDSDTEKVSVQVQKTLPVGEGLGFRASLERMTSGQGTTDTLNPFLQYNSRYGTYSAEYSKQINSTGDVELYRLIAAGGIVYVGNSLGLVRPVQDSFGLVQVGDLGGVRVYNNSQEIGRTDSSGRVFVPSMTSYNENQISINDKDVPLDYTIKETIKYVSPPLRSGSLIYFSAKKFQAVTGKIMLKMNGAVTPAEYFEIRMLIDKKEISFPTGGGGEFYLEDIRPGKYRAEFTYREKTCTFDIIVPESDEMILDLGGIVCEAD